MKDFLLRARVIVRTSNLKISRRRLADYVVKLNQEVCRTCSTIIFPHSTNQIIDLWRCRYRCLRPNLNSLISDNISAACMTAFSHLNGLCQSKVRELNVGAISIEEDILPCRNQTNRHWMRVQLLTFDSIYEWLPIIKKIVSSAR